MSSYQAMQYHSITLTPLGDSTGGKNTWDDWRLVPTSRPKFNMPSAKTNYVNIPAADGVLDLSTALTGRVTYANRQGSMEFIVMNDYGNWYERYSNIATYLHGQQFQAVLDDDPTYYYEGRFFVNEWKSDAHYSRIVLDYNVAPYKYSLLSPKERWLWDTFYFFKTGETDNTTYKSSPTITIGGKQYKFMNIPATSKPPKGTKLEAYSNMVVDGTREIQYSIDAYSSPLTITASAIKGRESEFAMSVSINGGESLVWSKTGYKKIKPSALQVGSNTFVFTGVGKIKMTDIGGRL